MDSYDNVSDCPQDMMPCERNMIISNMSFFIKKKCLLSDSRLVFMQRIITPEE